MAQMYWFDEGHLLTDTKNSKYEALDSIRTERRIILTGTPIQNNLGELFAIVQFVKPFILNSRKRFKSIFEEPINIALSNDATESEIKKGKQRMALLYRELEPFMHRRTSHLLQRQLLPKHEMVIYVKQSRAQADLYKLYLNEKQRLQASTEGSISLLHTSLSSVFGTIRIPLNSTLMPEGGGKKDQHQVPTRCFK